MAGIWNTWSSSGIGDYIHWRGENYRNYGINRNFGNNSFLSSATAVYQDLRDIVKPNAVNVQALEDSFNAILHYDYKRALGEGYADEQIKAAEAALETFVKNHVGSATEWNRADLSTESRLRLMRTRYYGLAKGSQQGVTVGKVKQLIEWAHKYIKEVNNYIQLGSISGEQLKELKQQKLNLENNAQIVRQYLANQSLNNHSIINFNTTASNGSSFRDLLNEIVSFPSRVSIPNTQELGAIGEGFAAMAALMLFSKEEEITEELIEKAVIGTTGKSHTQMSLSNNFVDIDYVKEGLNKKLTNEKDQWYTSGGNLISGFATQDTVDVSITIPDNSEYGLNKLNMSIKNYRGTDFGIHIIRETPLTAIFNLLNTNFVNHYLNMLAFRGENLSQSDFEKATETVQYALAVRGLSGARERASSSKISDFFVINDRSKNQISIFSTSDLLDKISKNEVGSEVKGLPKKIGEIKKANEWIAPINGSQEAAVQQRIANVILRTHAFKLTMSIKI